MTAKKQPKKNKPKLEEEIKKNPGLGSYLKKSGIYPKK